MLSPYRALDLTDDKGYLCGKILADLGADVIKIEKPGGDPGRNIGPFYQDIPHPEKSLFFFAYNNNKRSISLDIETPDGKKLLQRLVEKADFVLESFPPGHLDKLGLGYGALSQINPRLIMTSITPFGQEGPYKDYKGPDLVEMALGGYMYLMGDPDRPPVRISYPQTYLQAAACAAAASLVALYARGKDGQGQRVDVAAERIVLWNLFGARPAWELGGRVLRRVGSFWMLSSGATQKQVWPCKDGFVSFIVVGGKGSVRSSRVLKEWMDSEGEGDNTLDSIDWGALDMAVVPQEFFDRIREPFGKFFMKHTKAELYEGALKRGIWLYPLSSMQDIMENPQLAFRNYWTEVEHEELGTTITYPGPFITASETPLRKLRRAPLIGEHNEEIFMGELGLSRDELGTLKQGSII